MDKKIIYIMNVDWNWIKQRPHFVAEGLSQIFDTYILYQYKYDRKGYQNREENENVFALKLIPRIDRYKCTKWVNTIIKKLYLKKFIKKYKPDFLYLTNPFQYEWICNPEKMNIIYDCMDDYYSLCKDEKRKEKILLYEENIIKLAKLVIASSDTLKTKIYERYFRKDINVIRNGYSGEIIKTDDNNFISDSTFTICYFGTISYWFDFDIICESLKRIHNIQYLLIGPKEKNIKIPVDERIKYIGTVEHSQLYKITRKIDCFCMPFIISEAIESVDPVKLYEYINFSKNIICVDYNEVRRFSDFAFLYSSTDEYCIFLQRLLLDNRLKYSKIQREKFLCENSWDNRIKKIENLIKSCVI